MTNNNKIRLIRITTVPISLKLLLSGQLSYFQKKDFEVLAVSAAGPEIEGCAIDNVPHEAVQMTRKVTPFHDMLSLFHLVVLFTRFKPDIVHSHTPKAGLLGMLAAWICNVPVRMHTVAGLPLMEKRGLLRKLLILTERITYHCATAVYPNSYGLQSFIVNHIGNDFPIRVIGKGSSNGIDTRFFARNAALEERAAAIRRDHNIGGHDIVFSFVGRVVKDKGIAELAFAYRKCREVLSGDRKYFLLIVGPLEPELDPLDQTDLEFLTNDADVILAGYQSDVRPWIVASDLFVFPSYREGFPNVVLQACCLEVPCIVSDINGCNEIIVHNQTGLVVKPKSSEELYQAMARLASSDGLRTQFAKSGRERIAQDYDRGFIWEELHREYKANLHAAAGCGGVYRKLIKPFFDKLVALTALVLLSPVMLICMAVLAKANQGKVWFTQMRPGKDEKIFKLIKFRTMSDERDAAGELLPDKDRLHGAGRFIRKTSLDELPQLINVLKGDMSIVGPRPLLEEYLPLYNEEEKLRHKVTPGITGWAQVNGRNAISWKQKFTYDVWYTRHQSFWLDVKILVLTVIKVFRAEGISSGTSATMEKFRGNPGT